MGSKKKKERREAKAAAKAPGSPREASERPQSEAGAAGGSFVGAKGPALRFLLIAGGFMLLFYTLFYTSPEDSPGLHAAINSYLSVYASLAGAVLDVIGFDIVVTGQMISIEGTPVRVVRGCDAMEPIAMFVAAVLAVQAGTWRTKVVGILGGVGILVAANLLRIIILTFISYRFPSIFDTAHELVGQTLFILLTLGLWFGWVVWASNRAARGGDAVTARG